MKNFNKRIAVQPCGISFISAQRESGSTLLPIFAFKFFNLVKQADNSSRVGFNGLKAAANGGNIRRATNRRLTRHICTMV
jgi:hypothetical protein